MAKDKLIVCEVLNTVKGLDPKALKEYTHAGPADNPTLVDLPDNAGTAALIESGTIRIYPGPTAAPQLPESDKVKALLAKIAELEAALKEAGEAATAAATATAALKTALQAVTAATDLESAVKIAAETLA